MNNEKQNDPEQARADLRQAIGDALTIEFARMCRESKLSEQECIQVAYCAFYAMQKKARNMS